MNDSTFDHVCYIASQRVLEREVTRIRQVATWKEAPKRVAEVHAGMKKSRA